MSASLQLLDNHIITSREIDNKHANVKRSKYDNFKILWKCLNPFISWPWKSCMHQFDPICSFREEQSDFKTFAELWFCITLRVALNQLSSITF